MARNYTLIKLKGQTNKDILDNMKKLNIKDELLTDVTNIMKEMEAEGIINIEKKENDYLYTLKKELIISNEGKNYYSKVLQPLVDFPTLFFRSFFNIRELNVTLNQDVPFRDLLQKILIKSATQGFSPTNYVFKNLITYYEKIKEETN